MIVEKLRAQLSRDEGRIPYAYQDSVGLWTIGVGHLIDRSRNGGLPEHIIDALLEYDINKHTDELIKEAPWVLDLDPARLGVLLNMAFNLGVKGLLQFNQTLAAVKARDFDDAAVRMLQSRWATQVGPRATRLATQMRTGVWQ